MFKKISQLLTFNKVFKEDTGMFRVIVVDEPHYLNKAKQLHAKVYLARGFVKPTDLTDDALYIGPKEDPYQFHSQYFVVERTDLPEPQVVSAARLIYKDPHKGHDSFQTYIHQPLYKKYKAKIELLDPASCAEVSGLVKERGTSTAAVFMLYKAMWLYSVQNGYQTWLMSCDVRLYLRLKLLFGRMLQRIGEKRHFKGHDVVPLMLDTERLFDYLLAVKPLNPFKRKVHEALTRFLLDGVDRNELNKLHQAAISHE
ncbi:MAG TPA: hypothetical protein VHQ86_03180 [Candidatus Saccharimonadia bacterium]|nr:hypothetical protein [Candidatus Saccharimonadia bacterium]